MLQAFKVYNCKGQGENTTRTENTITLQPKPWNNTGFGTRIGTSFFKLATVMTTMMMMMMMMMLMLLMMVMIKVMIICMMMVVVVMMSMIAGIKTGCIMIGIDGMMAGASGLGMMISIVARISGFGTAAGMAKASQNQGTLQ